MARLSWNSKKKNSLRFFTVSLKVVLYCIFIFLEFFLHTSNFLYVFLNNQEDECLHVLQRQVLHATVH